MFVTGGVGTEINSKVKELFYSLANVLHMEVGEGRARLPAEFTEEDFTLPSVSMKGNIWTEHLFQATDLFLVSLQQLNEKEREKNNNLFNSLLKILPK